MGRAVLILATDVQRLLATSWIARAKPMSRIEFKGPQRSLPQNALLHALCTDISSQIKHNGRLISPERWKRLFMDALKSELDCEVSLDGQRMVPIGRSSADLSVEEMSDLVEVIYAWGASNGAMFAQDLKLAA